VRYPKLPDVECNTMKTEIVFRAHQSNKTMKIKIPKGWRKLRQKTILRIGDKYWSFLYSSWNPVNAQRAGCCDLSIYTYIRRIAKKKGAK